MSPIVCQVVQRPDRVTFLWSRDRSAFPPLHLGGLEAGQWYASVREAANQAAQGHVEGMVAAGKTLHRLLFSDSNPEAQKILQWVREEAPKGLDLRTDDTGVPWNFVCDPDAAGLDGCWGARYPLAVSSRFSPLRGQSYPPASVVWVVTKANDVVVPEATILAGNDALNAAVKNLAPDILCFLGSTEEFPDWEQLAKSLKAAPDGSLNPLVIIAPVGSPNGWAASLAQARSQFPALISSETPLSYMPASRMVRETVAALRAGRNVGAATQAVRRASEAASLGWTAYAPLELGGESSAEASQHQLPEKPYKALRPYESEDRPLFAGRDEDLSRFTRVLQQPASMVVLVHGSAGCGKSSFLRAGVAPLLEDDHRAAMVLRDRDPEETQTDEHLLPQIVVRTSSDLAGQLAEALTAFAATPFTYITPLGETATTPLPNVLSVFLQEKTGRDQPHLDPVILWGVLEADDANLGQILDRLSSDLPRDLVILADQAEELITQVTTPEEMERRGRVIHMLQNAQAQEPRVKLLWSIRTDFLGRFQDLVVGQPFKSFYLPDLDADGLLEAILLPTANQPIPLCSEVPASKYKFAFEKGFPEQLIELAQKESESTGQSVVAILQATCQWLIAKLGPDRVVRPSRLKAIGGMPGVMRRYVEGRVKTLALTKSQRGRVEKLFAQLFAVGPDGSLTRDYVGSDDVIKLLGEGPQLEKTLAEASDKDLIEVQELLIDGEQDQYVTTPQDTLARVAADIKEDGARKKFARAKVVDMLWVMIPLVLLSGAVGYFFTRMYWQSEFEDHNAKIEEQVKPILLKAKDMQNSLLFTAFGSYAGNLAKASESWKAGNLLEMRKYLLRHQTINKSEIGEDKDVRSFDWHYLWRLANPQRWEGTGHLATIRAVAISPDGKQAATGSDDGVLRVWDFATGKPLAALGSSNRAVYTLAYSPDGKTLACAGEDKAIRLFDLTKLEGDSGAEEIRRLIGHSDQVNALIFTKDVLISASNDKSVIVWDLALGKEKSALKEHEGPVLALALSPDGKTLASAGKDKGVILWDLAAGKKASSIPVDAGPVQTLAYSLDGKQLFAGGTGSAASIPVGWIQSFDPATGKVGATATHATQVFALACAKDALFSAGADQVVRRWKIDDLANQGQILGHFGWVTGLAVTAQGDEVLTGSVDTSVRVLSSRPQRDHEVWHSSEMPLQTVAVSGDNRFVAAAGADGKLLLFQADTGARLDLPSFGKIGPIRSLAFSKGFKPIRLAIGTRGPKDEGEIVLVEVDLDKDKKATLKEVHRFTNVGSGVNALEWNPDASLVGSANADGKIGLWDVPDKKLKHVFPGHKGEANCLAFYPEGGLLMTGGSDQTVRVWDLSTLRNEGPVIPSHQGIGPTGIGFLPNNFRNIKTPLWTSAGGDQLVRIWSLAKAQSNPPMRGHTDAVSCMALSPRGDSIITGSYDRTIRLWDPLEGERMILQGHNGVIRGVAMSPDGLLLVSVSNDGTLRAWRAAVKQ